MPEHTPEQGAEEPSLLQEFLDQLERISRQFPGSRLLVDMARDAGLDMVRKMNRRIKRARVRVARAESRQVDLQSRLADLLHELATSTAPLPLAPGQPAHDPDRFIAGFRQLRDEAYPALAEALSELTERGGRKAFVRFLAEEIFYRAGPIIAEHQLRHSQRPWSAEGEKGFQGDLRQHVAGRVNRALARTTGFQVTPSLGRHLDSLISQSLEALVGLMTASPQARLLVPSPGVALDSQAHVGHKPEKGGDSPVVGAVLFPGVLLLEQPPRVAEPAHVLVAAGNRRAEKRPSPEAEE